MTKSTHFRAWRDLVRDVGKFRGGCWYCEKVGSKRHEYYQRKREEVKCWACGEWGHILKDCQQKTKLADIEKQQVTCSVCPLRLTSCKRTTTTSCQVNSKVDRMKCPDTVNTGSLVQLVARCDQSSAAPRDITPAEWSHWTLHRAKGPSGCQVPAGRKGVPCHVRSCHEEPLHPVYELPGVPQVCAGLICCAADGQVKECSAKDCGTPMPPHIKSPELLQQGKGLDKMSLPNSGGTEDGIGKLGQIGIEK